MRLCVLLLALFITGLSPAFASASVFDNTSSNASGNGGNPFATQQKIPPVSRAMPLTVKQTAKSIVLQFQLFDQVYLYRHKLKIVPKDSSGNALDFKKPLTLPPGTPHQDAVYGKTRVYFHQLKLSLPFSELPTNATQLEVAYQGCLQDVLCYPPQQKTLDIDWPATTATAAGGSPAPTTGDNRQGFINLLSSADANQFASWAASQSLPYVLLLFFVGGLLMAFTPCVFPMFPILLGILAGSRRPTPARGFVVSLAYVLGMAVPYTLAGLAVALFGARFNLHAWLQQPAAIIISALIFGLLALAMFGLFELQLPTRLRDRLGSGNAGGSIPQAAVIGAISGLVVSPCITPVLAGALLFVAAQGQLFSGALALFVLSLGMGVPLLIIGAGGASLLPRAGGFMDDIKHFFGLVLLLVGIWLLSRLLAPSITLGLYGIVLFVYALMQGALDPSRRLRQALALLIVFYASLLMLGAAGNSRSLVTPLAVFTAAQPSVAAQAAASPRAPAQTQAQNQSKPKAGVTGHFETVPGDQLAAALAAASAAHQPVLLDFFADWCTACKELDRNTLSNPRVLAAMQQFRLLRVDITKVDATNRKLMQQYHIIGLPALLFFTPSGHEINNARVLGYMNPDQWLRHLKKSVSPSI